MKNLKSTYKVLRTDVELDVKEISYLVLFYCANYTNEYFIYLYFFRTYCID